jgi:hypothetical protein
VLKLREPWQQRNPAAQGVLGIIERMRGNLSVIKSLPVDEFGSFTESPHDIHPCFTRLAHIDLARSA